jgi:hypothetical protein
MTPEEQKAADAKEAERVAALQKSAAAAIAATPVIIPGDGKHDEPLSITGEGFGMQGSLTIGGVVIKTTRWTDRSIKGVIPAGVRGAVVLTTAGGVRHGTFPHVAPTVTKTTTVTVETK